MQDFSKVKRKILSLILTGVIASSSIMAFASGDIPPLTDVPVNLVQNAGFDNPGSSTANWTITGSAWIISYNSYSGNSINLDPGSNNVAKQTVTVTEAGIYTASAWIAAGSTGGSFRLQDTATGAVLAEVSPSTNTAYTQYTLTTVELAAGQSIDIILSGGNGWVRGDEFSLALSSEVVPDDNLLINSNFNTNDGWIFQGTAGINNSNPFDGNHFYLNSGSANQISQTVTIPSDGLYHIGGWLCGNGSGTQLLVQDASTGNTIKSLTFEPTSYYSIVELPPVSLTASQQVKITCIGGTGTLYGDSFVLYPVTDLMTNGTFEDGSISPIGWSRTAWNMNDSTFEYLADGGVDGGKCIKISTPTNENHARWIQNVQLEPNTYYTVTGYVKGENISGSGRFGANLNFSNATPYESTFSETAQSGDTYTKGTFGWKPFTVKFRTRENGAVGIECGLGYYASVAKGTVCFDNLILVKDNVTHFVEKHGEHVSVFLEHDLAQGITNQSYSTWVSRLNSAYEAYTDLTGYTPYNGGHINIFTNGIGIAAWARSGQDIMWNRDYVAPDLTEINTANNWSFGILHEIGHDFDMDPWKFDGEIMANFKMYYVLDTLNATVSKDGKYTYTGTQFENFYKNDSGQSYNKTIALKQGGFNYDGITYTLVRVQKTVGWAPFKAAFREFQTLTNPPATKVAKFDKLLELVQKNYDANGTQVYDTFPTGELEYVRGLL